MNQSKKKVLPIVQTIIQLWEKGIPLDDASLFFLESTFGICSAFELENAFKTREDTDQEMILEMLMFPDRKTRLLIEPMMLYEGFSKSSLAQITQSIFNAHPTICVIHSKWADTVNLSIDFDQVELFVARLFFDRSLDSDICRDLEKYCSANEILVCRSFLRCHPPGPGKNKKQILIDFIQNAQSSHPYFIDLFEMTVLILSEAIESDDMASVFIEKRKQLKKMLASIQQFEQKQDRYSMEYLMMQRYPVPQDSFENILERLKKLDIIINDILCLDTPFEFSEPQTNYFGRFDPKTDMQDILNLLS